MNDDAMFLALFLPELRFEGKSNIVVKLPYSNTSAQGRKIKSPWQSQKHFMGEISCKNCKWFDGEGEIGYHLIRGIFA